jgi:hypothetical protein
LHDERDNAASVARATLLSLSHVRARACRSEQMQSGDEMDHGPRLDAFPLVAGIVSVVFGSLMLWRGERTGWSLLVVAIGVVLLATHWITARQVDYAPLTRLQSVAAVVALACVWIAVIYLSRGADDLPRMFPGHSGRSEHYRLLQGGTVLLVGVVLLARIVARVRPTHSR